MGYKVSYRGLEVVCETSQDVDALADRADGFSPKGRKRRSAAGTSNRKHRSVKKLMPELGQPQQELIKALFAASQPLSDAELRESLSLRDNKVLAGILASISKRAKHAGIEMQIISKTHLRNGTGERHYRYSISSEVLEEVRVGLGIEG